MPRQFFGLRGLGEMRSRRRFLTNVTFALSGLIGGALAVPMIGYIVGPLVKQPPEQWVDAGEIGNFPVGATTLTEFIDPSSLPWAGLTARTAAWVRHVASQPQEQFLVYDVHCTHLGCPVNWLPDAQLFECPCHGGTYYSNGDVAAGPPPDPLFKYQWRIIQGRLQLQTVPLRTAGFQVAG